MTTAGEWPHRALLMRFESLGTNCEFGSVQRHFGAEPLGLFRWAGIEYQALLPILAQRFEGIGDPARTRALCDHQGEYFLHNTGIEFVVHTWMNFAENDNADFFQRQCARLRFLAGKMIADLTAGEKIFVYKRVATDVTDDEVRALRAEMDRYGQAPLLCVRLAGGHHAAGTVERFSRRVLIGYIDRIAEMPIGPAVSYDCWLSICQAAAAKFG
jgi:hypothetical protein